MCGLATSTTSMGEPHALAVQWLRVTVNFAQVTITEVLVVDHSLLSNLEPMSGLGNTFGSGAPLSPQRNRSENHVARVDKPVTSLMCDVRGWLSETLQDILTELFLGIVTDGNETTPTAMVVTPGAIAPVE